MHARAWQQRLQRLIAIQYLNLLGASEGGVIHGR